MLYCPPSFAAGAERGHALAREHGFATLITAAGGEPWISHLALLPDGGDPDLFYGHLAAANPHAALLFDHDSVLLWQGEHGYVSPVWYGPGRPAVPTWNYRVAHGHGRAERLDEVQLGAMLDALVRYYEGEEGWSTAALDGAVLAGLRRGVTGFAFRVRRWDVKEKLSQNRRPDEVAGVLAALEQGDAGQRALARVMRDSA